MTGNYTFPILKPFVIFVVIVVVVVVVIVVVAIGHLLEMAL